MRIFWDEIQKRHRANFARLYLRHKAGIGYVILCMGLIIAFLGIAATQDSASHQAAVTRAVICENITRQDKETLSNLRTQINKELIKNLKITPAQLHTLIQKQLEASAEERRALQPSEPAGACTSTITTISPPAAKRVTVKHTVFSSFPQPAFR